jgi:predicted Zn-dependent protease
VGLGVSYLQRGNVQQAIQTLRKRIAEKPNDAVLQYLLGEALLRSGARPGDDFFKQARTALEKSVKLNPKLPAAQVDLGKIYLKENRLDEALQHLDRLAPSIPKTKVLIHNSRSPIVVRVPGVSHGNAGNPEQIE